MLTLHIWLDYVLHFIIIIISIIIIIIIIIQGIDFEHA